MAPPPPKSDFPRFLVGLFVFALAVLFGGDAKLVAEVFPELSQWSVSQVGAGTVGTASLDSQSGLLIAQGEGNGLAGSSDSGLLVHHPSSSGDALSVALNQLPPSGGLFGVQFRSDLTVSSTFVFVGWNGAGDAVLSWREEAGEVSRLRFLPEEAPTDWLRLSYKDGVVVVDGSLDGTIWTALAAVTHQEISGMVGGVFLSSGATGQAVSASAELVALEGVVSLGAVSILDVDPSLPGVAVTGAWQSVSDAGAVGGAYLDDGGVTKGAGVVTVQLPTLFGGVHDVFLLWSSGSTMEEDVPVDIGSLGVDDELGEDAFSLDNESPQIDGMWVNQRLGGHWASLGRHYLKPEDQSCYLRVENEGTDDLITIDAVLTVERPQRMPWKSVLWKNLTNTEASGEFGSTGSYLWNYTGGAAWNAGASSRRVLRGDGMVEWSKKFDNRRLFLGLSTDDQETGWGELNHALLMRYDHTLRVYENGTNLGQVDIHDDGDVFRIQRINGQISYFRNETPVYTSLNPTGGDLYIDTSFYENNGELQNVRWWGAVLPGDRDEDGLPDGLDGDNGERPNWEENIVSKWGYNNIEEVTPDADPDDDGRTNFQEWLDYTKPELKESVFIGRPIDWVGHWNTISTGLSQEPYYEGSMLRKHKGGDAWNADAQSKRVLLGDGRLVFRPEVTNKTVMVGFAADDSNHSYTTLDRALHLQTGGNLRVYKNGSLDEDAPIVAFDSGDFLSIERKAGSMHYAKNGIDFHVDSGAPSGHLFVDTSFLHQGGQISDARLSGAVLLGDRDEDGLPDGIEGIPENWEEDIVTFKGFGGIEDVNPLDDADGDGRLNGHEFYEWSDPTDIHDFRLFEDLEWTDNLRMIGSIPISGGGSNLLKNAGGAAWNAGAVGAVVLPDDGELRFGFAKNNKRIHVGFDAGNENHQPGTIDFRVIGTLNGEITIYEDGSKVFPVGGQPDQPFNSDDEFSIERREGVIRVWMNGKHKFDPLYTSPVVNHDWVRVDVSAYDQGAELWKCRVDGMYDFERLETGFEVSEGFSPGILDGQGGFSATQGVEVSSSNPAAGSLGVRLADYGDEFSASYPGHHSPHAEVAMEVHIDSEAEFLDDPSLFPENVATVVTFDPARGLIAWDGDGEGGGAWATAAGTLGLANQYVELRVQIDYEEQTWRLLVDGVEKLTGLGLHQTTDALSQVGLGNRNRRELVADGYRMKGTLIASPQP